jgi:hypothetical protein
MKQKKFTVIEAFSTTDDFYIAALYEDNSINKCVITLFFITLFFVTPG